MKTKICRKCKKRKALSQFHNNASKADGKVDECKKCANARVIRWNRRNPERVKAAGRTAQHKESGISDRFYAALYRVQEGKCAICEGEFKVLCRDHDHATGHPRGLLCTKCNLTLGFLECLVPGAELTRLDKVLIYLGRG